MRPIHLIICAHIELNVPLSMLVENASIAYVASWTIVQPNWVAPEQNPAPEQTIIVCWSEKSCAHDMHDTSMACCILMYFKKGGEQMKEGKWSKTPVKTI